MLFEMMLVRILLVANQTREILLHLVLAGQVSAQVTPVPEALGTQLTMERMRPSSVNVVFVLKQRGHPREAAATSLAFVVAANLGCRLRTFSDDVSSSLSHPLQHNWCTLFLHTH